MSASGFFMYNESVTSTFFISVSIYQNREYNVCRSNTTNLQNKAYGIIITIYIVTKYMGRYIMKRKVRCRKTRGTFNMYNVSCQDTSKLFRFRVLLFLFLISVYSVCREIYVGVSSESRKTL